MGKNWVAIRKLATDYAKDNTIIGMNCAEAVFNALLRSGAIDSPLDQTAVAYVSGFGGGGGGSGLTCGALASAIFANGIVHGRKAPGASGNRLELRQRLYQRYNRLVSDFVKIAGSGLCGEIIAQFPDGYKDERTRPNCHRIVVATAGIAVDYLKMSAEEAAKLEYDPAVIGIKNWLL